MATIKLSRSQWEFIGEKTGWLKIEEAKKKKRKKKKTKGSPGGFFGASFV